MSEWKFIRYPHGDGSSDRFTAEMYRLAEEPWEMENLGNDPKWSGLGSTCGTCGVAGTISKRFIPMKE